jgi:lipoyl(octanoyl) transferase
MLTWQTSHTPIDYPDAVQQMEETVAGIHAGTHPQTVWLLEHPSLYTAGTSARQEDLLDARFPVYHTGRGGQYTYHGAGMRIGYVMLDLKQYQQDVRWFVERLEAWLIETLRLLGVAGERRAGRVGIWVETPSGEAKIAALGVRLKRWVSYHGVALNVSPDLSHFNGIVPCGLSEYGVTSLAALGLHPSMAAVDAALQQAFQRVF